MGLFLATHINRIDKKGRVSVPAAFRATLSQETQNTIVGFRSYQHACIDVFGMSRMERLVSSADALGIFSQDQDDVAATIFADAHPFALDGDGRIVLPPLLCAHAELADVVAFVGRGASFQIWNPAAFDVHQTAARQRLRNQSFTLALKEGAL